MIGGLDELAAIGRDPATGGINRFAWTDEDRAAREWFSRQAAGAGAAEVEADRNGNVWAWFGDPTAAEVIVTGSHLDTVPDGGAFDGALGVAAGLLAAARVTPGRRPVAVVAFADEEGARFGTPCFGSRLMAGTLAWDAVRDRDDGDGVTLAEAVAPFGAAPGPDPERLTRVTAFVELHVEQGRRLDHLGAAVAVATGIWPHGRWRLTFVGAADHAGTTRLEDRRDPMLALAAAANAARGAARRHGAVATIGRVAVSPNGTNVIPARIDAWLDARAADDATLDALVADIRSMVEAASARHATVSVTCESRAAAVAFDAELGARIGDGLPAVDTAAGHDAGALAGAVPTAMLFVRNPTGVSHSPLEHADDADCLAGVETLVRALGQLTA